MRPITVFAGATAVAAAFAGSSPAAGPVDYHGSARALLPPTRSVPFPFRWVHRARRHAGYRTWKRRSGWTAVYAKAAVVPFREPPPGTPFADTIVYVFATSHDALAAIRSGARSRTLGRRQRMNDGAILWAGSSNTANGQSNASVTSVFRNVLTFSMGGGELPRYTARESRRDQIRVHRAIHRRVIALTG
jgi:hypothetical protein